MHVLITLFWRVCHATVWTGQAALKAGLVDALGGVQRAIEMAKEAAGIPADEAVSVLEVSRGNASPLTLLTGATTGAAAGPVGALVAVATATMAVLRGQSPDAAVATALGLMTAAGSSPSSATAYSQLLQPGNTSYLLTDIDASSIGTSPLGVNAAMMSVSAAALGGDPLSSAAGLLAGAGQPAASSSITSDCQSFLELDD